MNINILYNFTDNAWGGGNQFLKYLKKKFIQNNIYEEDFKKANIIIINSHHWFKYFINFFFIRNKTIIHRIDGPISEIRLSNRSSIKIDQLIYKFNNYFADGTIYQSEWSKAKNTKNGLSPHSNSIVLLNQCDPDIFIPIKKKIFSKKISIVISSWSSNINKGFKTYALIDQNLDFNKFDVTFIGNTSYNFKNIKVIQPLTSDKLSLELSNHHIYLTASINDPCSNSLIEAIQKNLFPIAFNSGGHPEILKNEGMLYDNEDELLKILNNLTIDFINNYRNNKIEDSTFSTDRYIKFILDTHKKKNKINILKHFYYSIKILYYLFFFKFQQTLKNL